MALFLFDEHGQFLEARRDDLGTRAELDMQRASSVYEQRLAELGEVEFCRIEVQPFEVERFGTTFGLVPRPPEDDDDVWDVELLPGFSQYRRLCVGSRFMCNLDARAHWGSRQRGSHSDSLTAMRASAANKIIFVR